VKNRLLVALMVLLALTSFMTFVNNVSATSPSESSFIVYDNINRANVTLGIKKGASITFNLTITNVESATLNDLLTSVFFKEDPGPVGTSDITFENSSDNVNWASIPASDFHTADPASEYQVELVIGADGGETLSQGENRTVYIRANFTDKLDPTEGYSIAVKTFEDANANRTWDDSETIQSESTSTYDTPIKIDFQVIMIRDIALSNMEASMDQVCQGLTVDINVTVVNLGNSSETFNVTLYYNTTKIKSERVENMAPATTLTLGFAWNTSGLTFPKNYTIWANITTLILYELTTVNNIYTYGKIRVNLFGDINGDNYVNGQDAIPIGVAFGSRRGEDAWDQRTDLNEDGYINCKDVIVMGTCFGNHYPP